MNLTNRIATIPQLLPRFLNFNCYLHTHKYTQKLNVKYLIVMQCTQKSTMLCFSLSLSLSDHNFKNYFFLIIIFL